MLFVVNVWKNVLRISPYQIGWRRSIKNIPHKTEAGSVAPLLSWMRILTHLMHNTIRNIRQVMLVASDFKWHVDYGFPHPGGGALGEGKPAGILSERIHVGFVCVLYAGQTWDCKRSIPGEISICAGC